jgi:hypothetical protein
LESRDDDAATPRSWLGNVVRGRQVVAFTAGCFVGSPISKRENPSGACPLKTNAKTLTAACTIIVGDRVLVKFAHTVGFCVLII